jgi:hypothetical protein
VTSSVSMSPAHAAVLRKRAKRLHGGNVSAALADAVELLRLEEERRAFAAKLDAELGPLDESVARAVLAESMGLVPPVRRKKKRVA